MRFWCLTVLLVVLTGCAAPSEATTPPPTAAAVQAALSTVPPPQPGVAATALPTIQTALPLTPAPSAPPTATPAPLPPRDVPALLDTLPPVALIVETAAADPAFRDLPAEVLLVNTESSDLWRQLVLVDPTGTRLVSPTADLERLGWCGPNDIASPAGSWSANGRYLIVDCQTDGEALAPAILDLEGGEWTAIRHDRRAMTPEQRGGDDVLGVAGWLVPDEQVVITQRRWTTNGVESESVYVFSLGDRTLRRIADFDTHEGSVSLRVSADHQQVAMIAQRSGDPGPGLYVWDGRPVLRHTPGETTNPFAEVTPIFDRLLDNHSAFGPPQYVVAPNGHHIAVQEADGWQVYATDGTAVASFAAAPPFNAKSATWSADGNRLWICQVEDQVGVHVMQLNLDGQVERIASYPNVGLPNEICVAESPDGNLAFSLTNPLVVIVDGRQREIGSVAGASQGWRPHP